VYKIVEKLIKTKLSIATMKQEEAILKGEKDVARYWSGYIEALDWVLTAIINEN